MYVHVHGAISLDDLMYRSVLFTGQRVEEEEGLPVDHLTLKNPVGIQAHLLIKEKEEETIGIALGMNLRRLNLLRLMAR